MKTYVDHVLALLPFEPAAYEQPGGPPCSYVGHPLIERLDELRPGPAASRTRAMPRSRWSSCCRAAARARLLRLTDIFGATLQRLEGQIGAFDTVLPTVPRHAAYLQQATSSWLHKPLIVTDEAEKYAAFRRARGALAASGTVTLELALSQIPMIGAYRVPAWEAFIARRLVKAPFFLLPNLIVDRRAVPELFQEEVSPGNLAAIFGPLLDETPERAAQMQAFAEIDQRMRVVGETPSQRAARIVLETMRRK